MAQTKIFFSAIASLGLLFGVQSESAAQSTAQSFVMVPNGIEWQDADSANCGPFGPARY